MILIFSELNHILSTWKNAFSQNLLELNIGRFLSEFQYVLKEEMHKIQIKIIYEIYIGLLIVYLC